MGNQKNLPAIDRQLEERQLGQFIPLHYHFVMLQDRLRLESFKNAIARLVQPSMHVVELGGGTGVLSSFAAQQGARVTCVERNPVLAEKAGCFLRENGLHESVTIVLQDALDFVPTEPVDVVICEMLHVGLLREKQLEVIDAFKRNYRAKFGLSVALPTFIPEASVLMVQPVEQDYDFAGYWAPVPLFQSLECVQESTVELGDLEPYSVVSYDEVFPFRFCQEQVLPIRQAGHCNALRFVTQNSMHVDMASQRAISWPNQGLVLPLPTGFEVRAGGSLKIQFDYEAGDPLEQLSGSLQVSYIAQRSSLAPLRVNSARRAA
ncbi:methyltransferase domain-containing protein [Aureliella helgolandensis]|uniref:methyltransferase domain-containing protein n=1 Tax=Aureliella helgolandensis TaxID=2527968 RepID=UPI001E5D4952|nr:methyltransferase domain-containing protein [Aureliella helgolandensis]